jgi:hypothetical protein
MNYRRSAAIGIAITVVVLITVMVPVSVMFSTPFPGCVEFFQIARDLATVFSMARVVAVHIGLRPFYAITAIVFIAISIRSGRGRAHQQEQTSCQRTRENSAPKKLFVQHKDSSRRPDLPAGNHLIRIVNAFVQPERSTIPFAPAFSQKAAGRLRSIAISVLQRFIFSSERPAKQ